MKTYLLFYKYFISLYKLNLNIKFIFILNNKIFYEFQ